MSRKSLIHGSRKSISDRLLMRYPIEFDLSLV